MNQVEPSTDPNYHFMTDMTDQAIAGTSSFKQCGFEAERAWRWAGRSADPARPGVRLCYSVTTGVIT
jgi:hypothetical protein